MDRGMHSGHRQRLRRRAQEEGLSAFNPHQVLELLLFYAIPRQDTGEIAHRLIDRFGTVSAVLSQPVSELKKVEGVGDRAAKWLAGLGALTRSYGALTSGDRLRIRNHAEAGRVCREMADEVIPPQAWQICMTPAGVVQARSKIADSAAWAEPECLRQSLDEILTVHARNVIIAVYPDGAYDAEDPYDRDAAREYGRVLRAMGVDLIDVIVAGTDGSVSLARTGAYDRRETGVSGGVFAENYIAE